MVDAAFHSQILALRSLSLAGSFSLPRFAQAISRYQNGLERSGVPTRAFDETLNLLTGDPRSRESLDHTAAQGVLAHLSGRGLFPAAGRDLRDFFDGLDSLRETNRTQEARRSPVFPMSRLFVSREQMFEWVMDPESRDLVPTYQIFYPLAGVSLERPAEVLKAFDRVEKRMVALKVYKTYLPMEDIPLGGLFNEMRFQSDPGEAPFVRALDAGRARSGDPYLAFELMEEGTIRDLMRRRTGEDADFEALLPYVLQMTRCAAEAHRRRIIHRDFKPDNFLLDNQGRVKLADFGIAIREEESDLFSPTTGTRAYLPPKAENSFRRDVYSLGLTLAEFLTLKPAYQAAASLPGAELPVEMKTFLRKALDPAPSHRHRTAVEMEEALEAVWLV